MVTPRKPGADSRHIPREQGRFPKGHTPNPSGAPAWTGPQRREVAAYLREKGADKKCLDFLLDAVDGNIEGMSVAERIKATDLMTRICGLKNLGVKPEPEQNVNGSLAKLLNTAFESQEKRIEKLEAEKEEKIIDVEVS